MPGSVLRTVVLVVLTTLAPASAYTVKSSVECPDIVREHENDTYRAMNKWWLMGYITGRNFSIDAKAGEGIDDEEIYQRALAYCRINSGDDWDDAAIHVYDGLD